jgi:hypothetical protein
MTSQNKNEGGCLALIVPISLAIIKIFEKEFRCFLKLDKDCQLANDFFLRLPDIILNIKNHLPGVLFFFTKWYCYWLFIMMTISITFYLINGKLIEDEKKCANYIGLFLSSILIFTFSIDNWIILMALFLVSLIIYFFLTGGDHTSW